MVAGDSYLVPGGVPHKVTALEPSIAIDVFSPANTQTVQISFRRHKVAKTVGSLAATQPVDGQLVRVNRPAK